MMPLTIQKAQPSPPEAARLVRQRAEAMIENLIALVDQIDGDPDFEPVNGWTNEHHLQIDAVRCTGANDEREIDHDAELPEGVVPGEIGH